MIQKVLMNHFFVKQSDFKTYQVVAQFYVIKNMETDKRFVHTKNSTISIQLTHLIQKHIDLLKRVFMFYIVLMLVILHLSFRETNGQITSLSGGPDHNGY